MLGAIIQAFLSTVDSLHQLVGAIVTIGVCGFAILAGGRDERIAGAVIMLASFATPLVQNYVAGAVMRPTLVAIDLGLLVVLGWLALRSDRHWPLWAAGFHLLSLLAYAAYVLHGGLMAPSLATALNLIAYLVLASLLLGTLGRQRQRRAAVRA